MINITSFMQACKEYCGTWTKGVLKSPVQPATCIIRLLTNATCQASMQTHWASRFDQFYDVRGGRQIGASWQLFCNMGAIRLGFVSRSRSSFLAAKEYRGCNKLSLPSVKMWNCVDLNVLQCLVWDNSCFSKVAPAKDRRQQHWKHSH